MPGVNINLSKKGASVTVGPRGASVNVGKSGTYQNLSIPGTGIYSREKISGKGSTVSESNTFKTKKEKKYVSKQKRNKDYSSLYLSVLYVLAVILLLGIIISFFAK